MPELPEVETIRKVLQQKIKDRAITSVKVLDKRIVKLSPSTFINSLEGQTFNAVSRIGKYILFTFKNDLVLVSHLRMEGKYFYLSKEDRNPPHSCVVFYLDNGYRLCYADVRKFGTMELTSVTDLANLSSIAKLGPEPFDATPEYLYQKTSATKRAIKDVLLDQSVLAGLGNIYVDEVLFLSKIHPLTQANLLTRNDTVTLLKHSVDVLNKAIVAGGTTIRTYQTLDGKTGEFQVELLAYGRENEECYACQSKLKKIFVAGRGTTYCPNCQKIKDKPLMIAITGMVGAGKSSVLAHLEKNGEQVYDADKIVANLYSDKNVASLISKTLNVNLLNENEVIDRNKLIKYLQDDMSNLTKLTDIVHPLVKKELERIFASSNDRRIFVEIALPYSYRINELFNFFIGIETSKEKQNEYLKIRGDDFVIVRPDEEYFKNRFKLDYIIFNDRTLDDLYNSIDNILHHF